MVHQTAPLTATPQQALHVATLQMAHGQLAEAEKTYRTILAHHPGFHPAYHGLGLVAYRVGKLAVAVDMIGNASALAPGVSSYLCDLCEMCRQLGRLADAQVAGWRAVQISPGSVDAHYNLGLALADAEDFTGAQVHYVAALQINPQHGMALNNLGAVLEKMGDRVAAEEAYRKAVALNPDHAEAQNNLGTILNELGKTDEARECFTITLRLQPTLIAAHHGYGVVTRYTEDDPHLATLEALYQQRESLTMEERIKLAFAVGKGFDDVGRYAEAFIAYEEGNRLQRQILPSHDAVGVKQSQSIIKHFNRDFFSKHQGSGIDDNTPIFIMGMPRSGTTLLEQVLSSHSQVFGAGELKDLHEAVGTMPHITSDTVFAEVAALWSNSDLAQLGLSYVERIRRLSADSPRITDKMPGNFFYLGLIFAAMPNAKVIHAMRDPMDSCLSNYTRLFNDTMSFTYDLNSLGRYYVRYMEMMQHWRDVLPAGAFLDVYYEDMVTDTEAQVRRILDFVELPWDDNCLNYQNNKRRVRTASVAQVRKPIYNSSVGSWKRFEKQLQPLLEIVKDYRRA